MKRQWVVGGCILAMVAAPQFMKTIALVLLLTFSFCNNGCLGFLAAILGAIIKVVVGVVSAVGPLLGAGMNLASNIVGAATGKQSNTTTANSQGVQNAQTAVQRNDAQNNASVAGVPTAAFPPGQ